MYPGRNINLQRELKLNRIVEEENVSDITIIPVESNVPMTQDFIQSINGSGLNIDDVSRMFYDQEYNSKLQNILVKHINENCIKKELSKDILGILDFHNLFIDLVENVKTFKKFIENLDCKYIVCNSQVGSFISDFGDFKAAWLQNTISDVSVIYKHGTLYGKDIYINPYMKWDENTLYCIKENFWDVSDYTISEETFLEETFRPRKELKFNVYFDKNINNIEKYEIK